MSTMKLAVPSLALAISACGGGGPSSGGPPATTNDLVTYQQLAANLEAGVTSYRAAMMAPGVTTALDCQRVHDAYDAQVRPSVSQMVHMAGAMDRHMSDHAGASVADFSCLSATMMYELDQHRAAACASTDITLDRTEAGRHVDAMLSYDGHVWDRCDQAMRGVNTGTWSWGPMMSGMHDAACDW